MYRSTFAHLHNEYAPPTREFVAPKRHKRSRLTLSKRLAGVASKTRSARYRESSLGYQSCE